ncbi:hypothetical protein BDR04DRAFT_1092050, partial [Suillus decipiens]
MGYSVAPPFPLLYVSIDDDHEDEDDENDLEEITMQEDEDDGDNGEKMQEDKDDGEGEGEDNISLALTILGKGAHSVFVDFAILNLTAVAQAQKRHCYGGWKITAVSVGLLVEVKHFPSRSLEGPDLEAQILRWVTEVQNNLI